MIDISSEYEYFNLLIKNTKVNKRPILKNVIIIRDSDGVDFEIPEDLLIDTGASISILRGKYQDFFKNETVIDKIDLNYGGGETKEKCNIYKVKLLIKGQYVKIYAAIDPEFPYKHSIFGITCGLDNFGLMEFKHNDKNKTFKLIKDHGNKI